MEFFTMIKKHAIKIKYLLVIAFFIIMIFSVEKYTNYLEILKAIKNVEKETSALQEKLDYITNFESKYLESDYSHFFLSRTYSAIWRMSSRSSASGSASSAESAPASHLSASSRVLLS